MIYIHDYNTTDFSGGCECVLDKLANVTVTHNLQQPHTLSFDCPCIDDKAQYVQENNIAVIEGQAYRISSVTKDNNKRLSILHVEAQRLFFADSVRKHIPNMPGLMGVDPYYVIEAAFAGTSFHLLTDEELDALGMKRIGYDGEQIIPIDFFSMDKTNPYAVCEAVIEAYGSGEIYVDNWNVAVVKRIGKDNGVRLTLDKNLETLSIQKQTTELCTRLYPYGKDDLIISSVNNGVPYIDADKTTQDKYGIIEGYKDYSEYTDPEKLKAAAIWDLMGGGNEYRLDTPQLTITGDMIDLSKLSDYGEFEKISLGDTVHVYDEQGNVYSKRVINITYYPFTSQPPKITIGSPSNTNLFYTQWQQQKLWKALQKNSTGATSKIIASYFNGVMDSSTSPIESKDGSFKLENALIAIKDQSQSPITRAQLGLINDIFTFVIRNAAGAKVLQTDNTDGGLSAVLKALTATTASITTLTVDGVDVGAKLIDLQEQIDELKEGGTNE